MAEALLTSTGHAPQEFLSSEGIKTASMGGPAWPSAYGTDLATVHHETALEQVIAARATLMSWLKSPESLADDDTEMPSSVALRQAIAFLYRLQALSEASEPPRLPLRGVAIGAGGAISIEFASGRYAEEFVFEPDGSAERRAFVSNRLRLRHPVAA